MTELNALLKSFSRDGKDFERLCKFFLESAPEYRSTIKRVWLWNDWPGRWGRDAGIDLVAETVEGELWAVQAKNYDPAYAIKKSDIDSFLSESSRPAFSYRLLIATTDRIGMTARQTLAGQEKPAGVLLRSQLEIANVEWPPRLNEKPRTPERQPPWPHAQEAASAVVTGLRGHDRGQLIMACGTGKTRVGLLVAEQLHATRTLVLLPSLSLLAQTLREWAAHAEQPFAYLAVCSDDTVVGEDAVVSTTSELGFPVTTDPARIARFLDSGDDERPHVVFSTYQSSLSIAEALRNCTDPFDLAIADEAHRCAGRSSTEFAAILDEKQIRTQRRLFMTATPRYFTGRVRKEALGVDAEIASMDDEAKFGPVLHRLSFGEAISRELLSDYQVVVIGVSDSTFREYAERGTFVTQTGDTIVDARTLATELGLLRAIAKYDLSRIVTFHARIKSAQTFSTSIVGLWASMPEAKRPSGALSAQHVSGEMSSGERDRRLNELRSTRPGHRNILSNARCLAEGVDVPALDGVAFIEPKRSQVDIVQAVGRAIRKAPGKTIGTIVLPVFIDENEEDVEAMLDQSSFNGIWAVVNALRAHDEILAEELDELRRELGRRGTMTHRPRKLVIDVPITVTERFADAFDARLITETTASWEFRLGLLERYIEREHTALVLQKHMEDGHTLGLWVRNQRVAFDHGLLAPQRASRLAALPGWTWGDPQPSKWDVAFAALQRFVEREGHTRVPQMHTEDDFKLGKWVDHQHDRRGGPMTQEQETRLAALPGWQWKTRAHKKQSGGVSAQDAAWERAFAHLERFVDREGTARVRHDHVEDGFKLGQWIKVQRYNRGALSSERAARLAALPGWVWNAKNRAGAPADSPT